MDASQMYIAISIAVLAVIAAIVFFINKKKQNKLTPLAGLAFAFVIAGIVFGGDDRFVGYGLMGVGIALSIVDIIKKGKK